MLFIQKGRLVTNVEITLRDKLGIIKDIINNKSVIVEFNDGTVERRSVKSLKLLDKVVDLKNNDTKNFNENLKWYQETDVYKRYEEDMLFKKMSDYERFVALLRKEIEEKVVAEKFGS